MQYDSEQTDSSLLSIKIITITILSGEWGLTSVFVQ